jgi:hypothetical protein
VPLPLLEARLLVAPPLLPVAHLPLPLHPLPQHRRALRTCSRSAWFLRNLTIF